MATTIDMKHAKKAAQLRLGHVKLNRDDDYEYEYDYYYDYDYDEDIAPCYDSWIGDGWCDDLNNKPECDYDGDDCCTDVAQYYCSVCECIEQSNTPSCVDDWIGDGFCDDRNNTPECDYDGNDCCTDTEKNYCNVCECIEA